jgi:hypothetical protein
MNARVPRTAAGQALGWPEAEAETAMASAAAERTPTSGRTGAAGRLLPLAPMFLNAQEAAEYLGVAVATFLWEVEQRIWPPGIRRGARGRTLTWFRPDLDSAAVRLAQAGVPTVKPDPPPPPSASLTPEDEKIVERIRRAKTKDQHQHRYPPKA